MPWVSYNFSNFLAIVGTFIRYAQPLTIIEMWDKYGVGNGAEVLEVQFECNLYTIILCSIRKQTCIHVMLLTLLFHLLASGV